MSNEYKLDDIIECKVTGIEKYGIFVSVDDNYSGLIHISEISDDFVRNVNDYVSLGDSIYCRVIEINEKLKQLKLSIKNINYRFNDSAEGAKETKTGFLPLKESLDKWVKDALEEYNK